MMPDLEAGATGAMTGGGYPTASGRSPIPGSPATRAGLIELARQRDAMVLRWGRQGRSRHGIDRH